MDSPNSGGSRPGQALPAGEFAVIERLRDRFEAASRARSTGGDVPPAGDTWIGDDAAVVGCPPGGRAVMASDLVVDGVHFDLGLCGLDDVGYKALMVTVSDLAAMGARPSYVLASVAVPAGTDLDLVGAGMAAAAEETGCVVVGGDLSRAPLALISTAAFGSLGSSEPGPLLRSGAAPGDYLLVTGPLGGSAAGLRLLRQGDGEGRDGPSGPALRTGADLRRAYRRPLARVREGEVARLAGATAAVDVSDGVVSDIRHLAGASGVGIALDDLPVVEGATTDEALHGGEDYELVIAVGEPDRLVEAYRTAGLREPVVIGRCTGRPGEETLGGRPLPLGGWQHTF